MGTVRTGPYRVFVVDDHQLIRQGLAVLATDPSLRLCGDAEGPTEAFGKLGSAEADIVITDLNLGSVLNGLDFIRALRERFPAVKILVNSMHDENMYGERALRAGTNGYVSKVQGSAALLEAAHRVLAGEMVISAEVQQRIMSDYIHGKTTGTAEDLLTDRELEVYKMIGWGLTGREIARGLSISKSTVESHRSHIKEKLGLESPAALVRSAVAWVLSGANGSEDRPGGDTGMAQTAMPKPG